MSQEPCVRNFERELRAALDEYAAVLLAHAVHLNVHDDAAWERYRQMPVLDQAAFYSRFEKQLEVVRDVEASGTNLKDPVQTVWRILKKFNWKPVPSLFERIDKKSIVEIFLPDSTQLFRCLHYFSFTSYSLSELTFLPWHELFEHPPALHEKLAHFCRSIFVEQSKTEYYEMPGAYIGREKFSSGQMHVELSCKALSPLSSRDNNLNEAVIVVWDMEHVPQNKRIME